MINAFYMQLQYLLIMMKLIKDVEQFQKDNPDISIYLSIYLLQYLNMMDLKK